jgi:hypothetical protein
VRFRRRPTDDDQLLLDLSNWVMRIDAKLDRILVLLGDDDATAEDDS